MHHTTRSLRSAHGRTRRLTAVGLAAVLGTGLLAGCADDSGSEETADGKKKVTVSIGVFGVFGYKQAGLYDEYEKLNPHVTIKENVTRNNEDYFPALLTHLSAGSGLQDIQAIEVNNITEITTNLAEKFVDVSDAPGVRKDDFLGWKWDQATADDRTIGLGTDIGPMGICYRKDLFEKAGLPTERDEVAKLWEGDWQKYVDAGAEYMKNAPSGTSFMDSGGGVFNGSVNSYPDRYYDEDGEPNYKDSENVRKSWDLAMQAIDGDMTGKLTQFKKPWEQALANNKIATVACPAWMLGQLKEFAGPQGEDQWDVASAPRPANWGGSFLAVPEASKNKDEALKLAAWLTAPEQQAKLFAKQASFPSNQAAYELPAVKDAKHEYFADAPIGQIFSEAAKGIPSLVLGPKDQIIGESLANVGIAQVEQQGKSPDQGWDAAVKSIDNALDQ